MKVLVFSYDRYKTATTPTLLKKAGVRHFTLLHDAQMRSLYIAHKTADASSIIVTNQPKGLARNRNYALDNLVDANEWCLMLVDDIWRVLELDSYATETGEVLPITGENQALFRAKLSKQVPLSNLVKRAVELSKVCDLENVELAGFAAYKNPMFRDKKFKRNVLCDGRALVVKNTGWRWDERVETIDDYAISAEHIANKNGTICNSWVLPESRRYTPGGYGSKSQRATQKRQDIALLVKSYPDLIEVCDKVNEPLSTHLKLKYLTPKQIQKMRQANENN